MQLILKSFVFIGVMLFKNLIIKLLQKLSYMVVVVTGNAIAMLFIIKSLATLVSSRVASESQVLTQ